MRGRTREELIKKCAGILRSDLLDTSEIEKRARCLADLFIELTGNTGTEPAEPEPQPAKEMKAKIIEFLRSKGDPLWQEIAATNFSGVPHP